MEELLQKIQCNKGIKKIYGLRYDTAFKNVFQNKHKLEQLLYDVFEEKIEPIKSIQNKEMPKENINFKCRICDMVVETDTDILLVEIQNKNLQDFKKRLMRYIFTLFSNQDFKQNYEEIKPVKTFLILYYKEGKEYPLKSFTKYSKEIDEQFDNITDIKVWNIVDALKEKPNTINYKYASLFTLDENRKEEAIEILRKYSKEERLKGIVEKLIIYNLDTKTYQKLKEEEMIETTFEFETSGIRAHARAEGLAEGLAEGRAEGRLSGKLEGMLEGKLETAKNLFSAGVPLELIIEATKLPEQQIKKSIGI